jgi:hypothetical protein
MVFSWKFTAITASIWLSTTVTADDCQPWTWNSKRDSIPGQVNCRYTLTSPEEVNYYTCTELANEWDISIDKFFTLNPDLDRECKTVKPNTEYCVSGCEYLQSPRKTVLILIHQNKVVEKPLATDGKCGLPNNNATCSGTAKQCCNSETWTCGDTVYVLSCRTLHESDN